MRIHNLLIEIDANFSNVYYYINLFTCVFTSFNTQNSVQQNVFSTQFLSLSRFSHTHVPMENIQNLMDVLQQHYHFEFKWHSLHTQLVVHWKLQIPEQTRTQLQIAEAQLEMQFIRLHSWFTKKGT